MLDVCYVYNDIITNDCGDNILRTMFLDQHLHQNFLISNRTMVSVNSFAYIDDFYEEKAYTNKKHFIKATRSFHNGDLS